MSTQSSSKHVKYKIVQNLNFNSSWSIIRIENDKWEHVSGPYLTESEAIIDLRNIECEQE